MTPTELESLAANQGKALRTQTVDCGSRQTSHKSRLTTGQTSNYDIFPYMETYHGKEQ
jgi:hypothetical protein